MKYRRTSVIVDAKVWGTLYMDTIEGEMSAKVGDYIFKTPQGWHNCDPVMFLANHDLI